MNILALVVMTIITAGGHVATAEYNSMAACENARRQITATVASANIFITCSKK